MIGEASTIVLITFFLDNSVSLGLIYLKFVAPMDTPCPWKAVPRGYKFVWQTASCRRGGDGPQRRGHS